MNAETLPALADQVDPTVRPLVEKLYALGVGWVSEATEAADEIERLHGLYEMAVKGQPDMRSALRIKSEEHTCCAEDLMALRAAANALLHQIDIGDFVDSNGHSAKMLKATHDLMRMLA